MINHFLQNTFSSRRKNNTTSAAASYQLPIVVAGEQVANWICVPSSWGLR